MVRLVVPSLIVLLAGCCHNQPMATTWTNPFDANSRIAPPPTGTAVPSPTTPYYQPPVGGQPAPGIQGNVNREPTPALAKTTSGSSSSATGFREVTTSSSDARLVSHNEPTKSIRVADSASTTSRTAPTTFGSGATRPVATLPPASQPRRSAGASRTNFGYRPDYSKIEGRLEYSPSSNQWKLRYIPIDGKTDRFGGSVVLVDTARMRDFEDGDFVSVDGEVGRDGQDTVGYAPAYHLDTIRRL